MTMNEAPTADGGPGFLAFLAFFILALALWFLMRNMNARMRRMSYRQQAAHRGKDDPQVAPGELGTEPDGPDDPQWRRASRHRPDGPVARWPVRRMPPRVGRHPARSTERARRALPTTGTAPRAPTRRGPAWGSERRPAGGP